MTDDKPIAETLGSIDRLIQWGAEQLREYSLSAVLDSQILAAKAFGCTRVQILSGSLPVPDSTQYDIFLRLIKERRKNIPVAYLVGSKEFWGLDIDVTSAVLIPRPESELVVSEALKTLPSALRKISVLDLGTGSGCLSIAIASELKKQGRDCNVLAIEKSPAAIEVARKNIEKHNLSDEIEVKEGDWFLGLNPRTDKFDVIVANPPYVASFEHCSAEVYLEPSEALFANEGGMADIHRIFGEAEKFLAGRAAIVCEIGVGKRSLVRDLLGKPGDKWDYEIAGDLENPNGFTVVVARRHQ